MRFTLFNRILFIIIVALLPISLGGCESSTEPKGPEMGAIEAYLQEHPEEREDDPDEAENEAAEFEAGE